MLLTRKYLSSIEDKLSIGMSMVWPLIKKHLECWCRFVGTLGDACPVEVPKLAQNLFEFRLGLCGWLKQASCLLPRPILRLSVSLSTRLSEARSLTSCYVLFLCRLNTSTSHDWLTRCIVFFDLRMLGC